MTSSMSLDRYFLNSKSISTTMGFQSLNDNIFDFYNYKLPPTTGYIPKTKKYMWSLYNPQNAIHTTPIKELIYLGNSKEMQRGQPLKNFQQSGKTSEQIWQNYFSTTQHWGNIFDPYYLTQEHVVLFSEKSPTELKTEYQKETNKWSTLTNPIGEHIQQTTHPLISSM